MRLLAIGIAMLGFLCSSQAQARQYHNPRTGRGIVIKQHVQHLGRYLAHRHWRHLNRRYARHLKHFDRPMVHHAAVARTSSALPGPCRTAAAMGGPCGCWTEWHTRGFLDHVREGINWWLAGDWLRLPRAIPVNGTAAVYKNRNHVAPVLHANNDGTVTVRDYWGVHKVSLAEVVIVDPHPPIRAGYRVNERWPL